jgi:hypothetical protein
MRARAGDPTDLRSSNPTHSPGRRTSFFLRHYKPAPNDGVDVKDLRPLTRSALPGRSWTPTPQPALPKNGGGRKKKDQPAVGRHSLTGPALSGMTMPSRISFRRDVAATPPCRRNADVSGHSGCARRLTTRGSLDVAGLDDGSTGRPPGRACPSSSWLSRSAGHIPIGAATAFGWLVRTVRSSQ